VKSTDSAKAYLGLLALSGLFAVAAILTLIPKAGASWPNIMGYKSLCTFSPGATLACSLLAGITCFIRARFVKRVRTPLIAPILVLALLTAGLAISTFLWAGEKARYTDAASGATARK